jgi:hypothetical protein
LLFNKNANFFAKNWEKSPKIVIITSTPGKKKNKKKLEKIEIKISTALQKLTTQKTYRFSKEKNVMTNTPAYHI